MRPPRSGCKLPGVTRSTHVLRDACYFTGVWQAANVMPSPTALPGASLALPLRNKSPRRCSTGAAQYDRHTCSDREEDGATDDSETEEDSAAGEEEDEIEGGDSMPSCRRSGTATSSAHLGWPAKDNPRKESTIGESGNSHEHETAHGSPAPPTPVADSEVLPSSALTHAVKMEAYAASPRSFIRVDSTAVPDGTAAAPEDPSSAFMQQPAAERDPEDAVRGSSTSGNATYTDGSAETSAGLASSPGAVAMSTPVKTEAVYPAATAPVSSKATHVASVSSPTSSPRRFTHQLFSRGTQHDGECS